MVENLDWIAIAQRGFEAWKAKPHNARWFRKIDGTPIPNDLTICIGQAFADLLSAKEVEIERLKVERDEWKETCRRAGVCMSCATSTRDPMGCTDCMNTGWDGGSPLEARMAEYRAETSESRATALQVELDEAKNVLENIAKGLGPARRIAALALGEKVAL